MFTFENAEPIANKGLYMALLLSDVNTFVQKFEGADPSVSKVTMMEQSTGEYLVLDHMSSEDYITWFFPTFESAVDCFGQIAETYKCQFE